MTKLEKISGLFMIMLVVGMILVTPALACGPSAPIDKSDEQKILSVVSKEITLPKEFNIVNNPESGGFLFIYKESSNSFKMIDISKDYEINETWTGTFSLISGGYQTNLVSNKSHTISATYTGNPSSNTGEVTVYDSVKGTVTTHSLDCYQLCMSACSGMSGYGCAEGCPYLCSILIETGIGYVVCVGLCLGACFIDMTYGCDKICNAIC
ncbi:hypothetical protein [Methanosarcina mazei]|uniref:Uncharacterized protein n=2 Tax=Methanosarcina mazei TaxID=2209 RepID=A0A0F8EL55_METMZ|nr:hypothetical protein [Methanosarcina mazei]AKB72099.1 hypothetical protein MSMAC_2209 [Methanosarcina mazei C16]KKG15631.1 hypothetical protein DU34_02830 [Methanosarcina mazei]KKG34613.1 hypothetical protein DU49_19650 [Methanosarcina mazei]KKG41432.1 hypothetical protein DU35_02795 [Methanosarcina mazei]KKG41593.1 hypothetical protein DU41_12615 [Methanosarcina mazei]